MSLANLTNAEKLAVESFVADVRVFSKKNLVSISLFGSRARGEGTEDSDVDVLVLVKKNSVKIKNRIWDIANDIFLEKWVNISPLVMAEDDFKKLVDRERLLASEIKRDGVIL